MEFTVLGALEATHDGRPVSLGRRRERCLLGILLLEAGTAIPVERLVELLWEDEPPRTVHATLRTHVSRLREHVDPGHNGALGITVRRTGDAYTAQVNRDRVDALRFCDAVEFARDLEPADKRAGAVRDALKWWHGPLLAGELTTSLRDRLEPPWTERRLAAVEMAIEADLDAGRHRQVIGELRTLTAEHPLRERFTAMLMLALCRDGRQADALDAFGRLTHRLRDELGLDPNPGIRRLHLRILEGVDTRMSYCFEG